MSQINEIKYKNIIEYGFYSYSKIELQQLLYYVDFVHYRDYGKTITEDVYIKKDFGALGKNFDTMYKERVLLDFAIFDQSEKDIINKVWNQFKYYHVSFLTNQVKAEAPWLYAEINQEMDYKLAKDIDII